MNSTANKELSTGDVQRRRGYLEQNLAIFKLQGYEITDELVDAMEKWVTGEMSDAEHMAFLEKCFKTGSAE